MNPSAAALSASNLTMRFGRFVAIDDVTLSIPVGARYALIGPNGAGKTTFVNLLTGMLSPTAGDISIGGEAVTHLDTRGRVKRGLSRTFQINMLFPDMTPSEALCLAILERDNIAGVWWKQLSRMTYVREEAEALLRNLRLLDSADIAIAELPYGRQRLLEIALALASKPKVLLLDEPAAGIPAGEGREVLKVIDELPDDISILFIEHDMDLVFRFAKRVIVLASGAILASGTPDEIRSHPEVRSVYLGSGHV